ncbi:MAG: O-antigen ligase family protein [Candidatus Omnitrophota bacterium]|jgi:O-antigen ligase
MVKEKFERKNITTLLIVFSVLIGLLTLISGAMIIPILFFFITILYIFFNLKNSIILAIGITPMMNICVFHSTIADIRISQLIWGSILVVALINRMLYFGMDKLRIDAKIWLTLFILIGISFLSIIPSGYKLITLRKSIQLVYLAAIFIIILTEINSIQMLNKAVLALLLSSIIFIGFGFLKVILGYSILPFIEIDSLHSVSFTKTPLMEQYAFSGTALFKRADAFFWGPVATAAYLIPIIILSISLLFDKDILAPKIKRLCYFCSLFGPLLLLLTFSRAGFIIFSLLLLFLYFLKHRIPKQLLIILIIIIAVFTISMSQRSRLLEIASLGEASTQSHFRLWMQAIVMFLNKPILGYGAGTFSLQRFIINVPTFLSGENIDTLPHNMFLLMAAETGIVGLFSLVIFLFLVIKNIWIRLSLEQDRYLYNINLGFFLGIIGVILMNLTMNFFTIEIFWVFLGLGYVSSNIINNKKFA